MQKQNDIILIDGVNVAECKYTIGLYNGVYRCINLNLNPDCCKNPNCYFKQLQRVKADIEELKEYNDSYDIDVRALLSEKDKLQAENEKLKEIILKREQTDRERIGCKYPSALELSIQLSRNTTIEIEKQKAENEKLKKELDNYRRVD